MVVLHGSLACACFCQQGLGSCSVLCAFVDEEVVCDNIAVSSCTYPEQTVGGTYAGGGEGVAPDCNGLGVGACVSPDEVTAAVADGGVLDEYASVVAATHIEHSLPGAEVAHRTAGNVKKGDFAAVEAVGMVESALRICVQVAGAELYLRCVEDAGKLYCVAYGLILSVKCYVLRYE